VSGQNVVGLR